ncbi:MAG: (2Fe-2S)-binding protein [Betaproteobacteria bacterium]|nr:(2Fe-2S)-binding protein [Betaproteobacteria bacterium]
MDRAIKLSVNGDAYELLVDPTSSLANVLREKIGLTGTKTACGRGNCGSCTVLLGGRAIFACLKLVADCEGEEVLTIEGLAQGERLHPIQQAFIDRSGFQCGFCTPGMIMATKSLVDRKADPTDLEARAAIAGHICRCGSYAKIVQSMLAAAAQAREGHGGE